MSFYWEASVAGKGRIREGNWGRDINCSDAVKHSVQYVKLTSTKSESRTIIIDPVSGVFYVDKGTALQYFSINVGGYNYILSTDTIHDLLDFCPYTTAVLSVDNKENRNVERHFMLRYLVTEVRDKVSNEFVKLDSPITVEFLVGFAKESGIFTSSRRM